MAYCVVTDVQALNAQRPEYGSTTVPTRDQVGAFIDQVGAEIDAVLIARGITPPVTAPGPFLLMLRRLNALGAAALAETSAYPEAVDDVGGSRAGSRYYRMYQDGLGRLIDGSAVPPASTTGGSTRVQARSYGTDNPEPDGQPPAAVFGIGQPF